MLVFQKFICPPLSGFGPHGLQKRFRSSVYSGNFSRIIRDIEGASDATLLKELYRSDPEGVIKLFESQRSLHYNPSALSEYVKALVKVDRLDESKLLKTLQRGLYFISLN